MERWHSGNKKEEAEDGRPPKGGSLSPALLKIWDVSPALRLAGTGRPPQSTSTGQAIPSGHNVAPLGHASSWPGSHEKRPVEEHRWEQPPAQPARGNAGCFHPATQKITSVRIKGPSTDSGDSRKSMPGDPECLIPPLPSDWLNNLDLRSRPFHPPAPTPDSSPERRK